MEYLKIRNWKKWQTYRSDRGQPPWIKIHRRIMRNPEWVLLSDAERGQLVCLWLLAADHDGAIPASSLLIQKLCFLEAEPDLNKFMELGFICQDDANMTPVRRQHDEPKAEAEAEEEKNRIKRPEVFNLPSKEQINESARPKLQDDLKKICDELYETKIFPKVHAFKNKMLKEGKNERAILHALSRCFLKKTFEEEGGAWAYCTKIMKVEDGNFNERDYLKTFKTNN